MKKIIIGAVVAVLLLGAGAVYAFVSPALFNGETLQDTTALDSPEVLAGEPLQATVVSTGDLYGCAITLEGGAVCWGRDSVRLGNGSVLGSHEDAAPVVGLDDGVTDLSSGLRHVCAIHHGAAKCWGENSYGELGDGTDRLGLVPVQVAGLETDVTNISAGNGITCAVQRGAAKCWGNPFASSPTLGDGAETNSTIPVQVQGLTSDVRSVAAGDRHACALISGGAVACWGNNSRGQLGDGSKNDRNYPAMVVGLPDRVISLSARWNTTCAVTIRGAAFCWGDNSFGQLGDGSTNDSSTPVPVFGITSGAASISVGGIHTCALMETYDHLVGNGRVRCWGNNFHGQFGNGSTAGSFIPVPTHHDAAFISSGDLRNCAVYFHRNSSLDPERLSKVKCWGTGGFRNVDGDVMIKK